MSRTVGASEMMTSGQVSGSPPGGLVGILLLALYGDDGVPTYSGPGGWERESAAAGSAAVRIADLR